MSCVVASIVRKNFFTFGVLGYPSIIVCVGEPKANWGSMVVWLCIVIGGRRLDPRVIDPPVHKVLHVLEAWINYSNESWLHIRRDNG